MLQRSHPIFSRVARSVLNNWIIKPTTIFRRLYRVERTARIGFEGPQNNNYSFCRYKFFHRWVLKMISLRWRPPAATHSFRRSRKYFTARRHIWMDKAVVFSSILSYSSVCGRYLKTFPLKFYQRKKPHKRSYLVSTQASPRHLFRETRHSGYVRLIFAIEIEIVWEIAPNCWFCGGETVIFDAEFYIKTG